MRSVLDFEPATLPGELDDLRAEVRDFLTTELARGRFTPTSDSWMSAADLDFTRTLAGRGWVGMTVPKEYGGQGWSALERFVVVEELVAAGAPIAAHWIGDRQIAPGLVQRGTDDQRLRFLPGMCSGDIVFAIGMSEPDTGSDLASVRTRGTRVDGGWSVTGTKVWTSGAHIAQAMMALIRTGPPGDSRHEGLTQMIIELPSDGVQIRPIVSMGGSHHFNQVTFTEVFVPDANVFGKVGAGWAGVTGELAYERSGPERLLSTMPVLRLLATRGLIDQITMGRLLSRAWCLREASISIAMSLSRGHAPDAAAAVVKELGTRFEREVLDAARGVGVEPDSTSPDVLARMLAHAQVMSPTQTLRGGTNEILRGIVAKAVGVRASGAR